jgi:N-acetylneuraminic acid mutarotase
MARNSHAGAVLGDELHIISGRTVAGGQTPAHHVFDTRSSVWRNGPDFPEPRGGVAAAAWRGRIVAGGGEIFEPGSVGDTLYGFDGGAWSRLTTMPTPRHGHGLVAAGDALYALGGARRPSASGTLASVDVLS